MCADLEVWCQELGSEKVEGRKRKRRKGVGAEMMAFLNTHLTDRETCCYAVITVTRDRKRKSI